MSVTSPSRNSRRAFSPEAFSSRGWLAYVVAEEVPVRLHRVAVDEVAGDPVVSLEREEVGEGKREGLRLDRQNRYRLRERVGQVVRLLCSAYGSAMSPRSQCERLSR